jgi:hypothetical protein
MRSTDDVASVMALVAKGLIISVSPRPDVAKLDLVIGPER